MTGSDSPDLENANKVTIDYSNLKMSLKNLEMQHAHLLHLSPEYPLFIQEAMAESVIQRFETCYDTLWKVLRRTSSKSSASRRCSNSPRPIFRVADENRLLAAGGEQWQRYIRTRIDTTHDYNREKAANAIATMPEFISDTIKLYTAMTGEPWE